MTSPKTKTVSAQAAKKRGRPAKVLDPFQSAAKAAADRLEIAIKERAECMAKTAMLSVEIPALTETLRALKNQMSPKLTIGTDFALGSDYTVAQPITIDPMQYAGPDLRGMSSIPAAHPSTNVLEIPESGELPDLEDSL